VIKQRILDDLFDDPVKRTKETEDDQLQNEEVINFEKSMVFLYF
jgi:hypothetical protein